MKKYTFNEKYKICINKDGGIFDYYIEKKGYGDLYWICGLTKEIEKFPQHLIEHHIKDAKKRKFWQ